jgi:hypothetical protein
MALNCDLASVGDYTVRVFGGEIFNRVHMTKLGRRHQAGPILPAMMRRDEDVRPRNAARKAACLNSAFQPLSVRIAPVTGRSRVLK